MGVLLVRGDMLFKIVLVALLLSEAAFAAASFHTLRHDRDVPVHCRDVELEDFDVDGETIMVAPAGGFYSTPNVGLNQIRIAYVLKKESLIKAVNILKEALKVYKD